MKKILFGIFAHPDDEAFGPAATLIKETRNGTELHLICATNGERGANPDHVADLGACRLQEWQTAAQLLGATKCYPLGFPDGGLCCNIYHDLANKITEIILGLCNGQKEPISISLLTLDTNGITGHLDHIAVSYVTTFVFYKLKATPPPNTHVNELLYYCLSTEQMPSPDLNYFVYRPKGKDARYINRQEAIPDELIEQKFNIFRLHTSQRNDAEALIRFPHKYHTTDNFHIIT